MSTLKEQILKANQFTPERARIAHRKAMAARKLNTARRRLATVKTADPRIHSRHAFRLLADLQSRVEKLEERIAMLERPMTRAERIDARMQAAHGPPLAGTNLGSRKPAQPGRPGQPGPPAPLGIAAPQGPIQPR